MKNNSIIPDRPHSILNKLFLDGKFLCDSHENDFESNLYKIYQIYFSDGEKLFTFLFVDTMKVSTLKEFLSKGINVKIINSFNKKNYHKLRKSYGIVINEEIISAIKEFLSKRILSNI